MWETRARSSVAVAVVVLVSSAALIVVERQPDHQGLTLARAPIETSTSTTTRPSAPSSTTTTVAPPPTTTTMAPVVTLADTKPVSAALNGEMSCDALLPTLQDSAIAALAPWGYSTDGPWIQAGGSAATSDASSASATGGTNVQVAGVDEPDHAKVGDGFIAYSTVRWSEPQIRPRTLIVAFDGGEPFLASTIEHGGAENAAQQLVVGGTTLISTFPRLSGDRRVTAVEIRDVRNPAEPTLEGVYELDGRLVSARRVGERLHLVLGHVGPSINQVWPSDDSAAARDQARAENERTIRSLAITDWIGDSPCPSVHVPSGFSGTGRIEVRTIDLQTGDERSTSVVGNFVSTVYATDDTLLVSAYGVDAGLATTIHAFSLGDGATYVASGGVAGLATSPWRFSVFEGRVRVVSDDFGTNGREVVVSVLEADGDVLRTLGTVRGFPEGHRAYGVRFDGNIAYVVTYLRIDPLHVVDLSDPFRPTIRGVLETPGFSNYLHPVADGSALARWKAMPSAVAKPTAGPPNLYLGVGQSDDAPTRMQTLLYDVTDPDAPTARHRLVTSQNSSRAEWDHHAFVWDTARSQALLAGTYDDSGVSSVLVVGLRDGALVELGQLRHPDSSEVDRVFLVQDRIVALSIEGISVDDADTLERWSWLPFTD